MKKNYLIYISSFILLFIMGCDLLNNEDPGSEPDVQDPEGNLVILNYSDERIVLFDGETKMKVISNSSEGFLVNIPNANNAIKDLRIYKYTDIEDNIETPDLSLVFKRWSVVLSADTDIEHRATWRIRSSASTDEQNTGTLEFAYMGGTDYTVDVYVDNKNTGAKLVSLTPGQTRLVGVEYDNYVLFYYYWYNNLHNDPGVIEEGWIESGLFNGEEFPIYLIINDINPERHIQIPHWVPPLYGKIEITNNFSQPITIFANDELIEDLMWTSGWTSSLSIIQSNAWALYFLEVGIYNFSARLLVTGEEFEVLTQEIYADSLVYWNVDGNPD